MCGHAQTQKHGHEQVRCRAQMHTGTNTSRQLNHGICNGSQSWGCLPCTRHCAGHHTHVTSLDPPKHLPTTSEASSIVIPILRRRKVRHREVRGHAASARAGTLTQFCLTWEPSLRSTRPQTHHSKHRSRHTTPRAMSTYTKRYTARNTEPCHYIDIQTQGYTHASKESDQNPQRPYVKET